MKITILQGAFISLPPFGGGAVEKLWDQIAREFAERGHIVTHLSRRHPDQSENEVVDGVSQLRIRGFNTPRSIIVLKFLDLIYTIRCLSRLPDADIVVSNTFWYPILCRRRKGQVIVDVQRMPKGQMRFYGRAALLRANSSAVVEAILEEYPKAESRTVMVPNPLPFKTIRELDSSKKEKHLLYVGRIHPEKGIELLLSAFHLALESPDFDPDWELHIVGPWTVGEGGGGDDYRDQLMKKYSSARITWHPPENDTDRLNAFYEKASIFAYPSLAEKGETFGLAPLEAMAWGCVPIVSELKCFKDFIKDGRNGFVFDHRAENPKQLLAEAILKIASANREVLMGEVLKVRETHSVKKIANDFLSIFNQRLNEGE